jgi:hypothetical protein
MTGPAAGAERETLDGGDAARRAVRASDGVELHHLRWCSGRTPPWAVGVFLHGIASHGGWFAGTAADLDTYGVAVYIPAPATPWISSRTAAATWPTWSDGCRLGSRRRRPGRRAVDPRCRP